MDARSTVSPLTARERQVASLIGSGYTNRQIGRRLGISERTVGAHIQNILNKLGAKNRAQIATWSARNSPEATSTISASPPAAVPRPNAHRITATATAAASRSDRGRLVLVAAVAIIAGLLIPSDDRLGPSLAVTRIPVAHGALAYEAQLDGSGAGFSIRYILGQPDWSDIRFVKGAVEYSVLKPGGNTGHTLSMPPLAGYFAEVELSVKPGSEVTFWCNLGAASGPEVGHHLVNVSTTAEAMQLAYFVGGNYSEYLGPQVAIRGLQTGRRFTISARVDPPQYEVYLDAIRVISLRHEPSPLRQVPSFAVFGEAPGMVRVSAIRVYTLS